MKREHQASIAALVVVACGAAFYFWRAGRQGAPQPAAPTVATAASAPVPVAVAPSAPAILHPIEALPAPEGPPDATAMLTELFGRKAVDSLFVLDDFPNRIAATVDNLGRAAASPRLWPIQRTGGRFSVATTGDETVISADNGLRYTPFLLLVETVDMPRVAQTYKRLYPQIQKAYEGLGYPNGYFNDRLVEVIDSMLATPEPDSPLQVRLPRLEGDAVPARPWLLYEFADPALAALPAGQKLLLRMGPVNERRLKAKLAEFRRLIAPAADGH